MAIEFCARPGDTVPEAGVLAVIHGRHEPDLESAILAATRSGRERTFEQDPLFAVRVLADIALRGLSPAVNDPTTAVQALDAIDSLLRPLAECELDIGWIRDERGTLRVSVPMPTCEDFITVALDEVIPSSRSPAPIVTTSTTSGLSPSVAPITSGWMTCWSAPFASSATTAMHERRVSAHGPQGDQDREGAGHPRADERDVRPREGDDSDRPGEWHTEDQRRAADEDGVEARR